MNACMKASPNCPNNDAHHREDETQEHEGEAKKEAARPANINQSYESTAEGIDCEWGSCYWRKFWLGYVSSSWDRYFREVKQKT